MTNVINDTVIPGPPGELAQFHEEIRRLNVELNNIREARERQEVRLNQLEEERDLLRGERDEAQRILAERQAQIHMDLDTMCDIMQEAANDHSLCHVYDETVEVVNSIVRSFQLPLRRHNWLVSLTIEVSRYVEATDEDDATEQVLNMVRDELRRNYIDIDDLNVENAEISDD